MSNKSDITRSVKLKEEIKELKEKNAVLINILASISSRIFKQITNEDGITLTELTLLHDLGNTGINGVNIQRSYKLIPTYRLLTGNEPPAPDLDTFFQSLLKE